MRIGNARTIPVFVSMAVACTAALAQGGRPALDAAIDSLYSVSSFEQVAISPDGTQVAWVERSNSEGSGIFVSSTTPGAQPRRISTSEDEPHEEGHLAWSRDSKHMAYLSDVASAGQFELYVTDLDGAPAHKLTNLLGFLDAPTWSPDGKTLAMLLTENAPRPAGPLMPMTPESGVIANKIYEQRLVTVEVATGTVQRISPSDMYVYEYDWSPDGKRMVVTSAKGAGDANWYVAQLYTLSSSGGEMKSIYRPELQIAVPRSVQHIKTVVTIDSYLFF